MARRTHLREVGCIACDELEQVGAGKEGWLVQNPSLLTALDSNSLALALPSLVLVLAWHEPQSQSVSLSRPIKIRPSISPSQEGQITAVQWLIFDDLRALALGTSNGYLLIYSLDADLIHKQVVLLFSDLFYPFLNKIHMQVNACRIGIRFQILVELGHLLAEFDTALKR